MAADRQANLVLSDEILEKAEDLDRMQDLTAGFEKNQKLPTRNTRKSSPLFKNAASFSKKTCFESTKNLVATEAILQGELKGIYQRLVDTRDEEAIAPLEGRSCGGCNTSLPPRTLDRLRMNEPMTAHRVVASFFPPITQTFLVKCPMSSPWYADGLRFQCTQCGNCCSGPGTGFVWVDDQDIEQMAAAMDMSDAVESFRRRFIRQVGTRESLVEYSDGDCIFLDPQKRNCMVYEARPIQCRTWPFWDSNLESQDTWRKQLKTVPAVIVAPSTP